MCVPKPELLSGHTGHFCPVVLAFGYSVGAVDVIESFHGKVSRVEVLFASVELVLGFALHFFAVVVFVEETRAEESCSYFILLLRIWGAIVVLNIEIK